MKKFISILLLALIAVPTAVTLGAGQQATVFDPITGERKVVNVGDANAFDGGFLLETPTNNFNQLEGEELNIPCTTELCGEEELNLGAAVVTRYRTRLTSSMTSTQTTVPVASVTSFDSVTLTMALLDGVIFLTAEPGTSREEIIKCTDISSLSWTSCTRGLGFTGKSEAEVANNRKAHNAGSVIVMSNVHFVYAQLADIATAETFTGIKTFNVYPLSGVGEDATTSEQFITKGQADNLANQGAATSSPTVAGIGEQATARETASTTASGGSPQLAFFIPPNVATSTPGVSCDAAGDSTSSGALCIPVAQDNGKIHQSFFDLSEDFTFTGDLNLNANSGQATTTLDATSTLQHAARGSLVPVGSLVMFTTTSSPQGWLLADGTAISRTVFSDLFDVIGETYGNGDGSTTFNVPNMKQRIPLGLDASAADGEGDMLGETGGATSTVMTIGQLVSHNHTIPVDQNQDNGGSNNIPGDGNDVPEATINTGNAGGGGDAIPTLDPYLTVNYIIKY